MSTLTCLIVDDESLARKLMLSYLLEYNNLHVIGECNNGREAIDFITQKTPDLVFLDIQMPGINGLDVVKSIQADIMPLVIFSTAYEQYALDAFDLHAVDYILKPIDNERLAIAIERAFERYANYSEETHEKPKLINAINDIHFKSQRHAQLTAPAPQEDTKPRTLAIKDTHTITFVNEEDIDWIDAAGDYMCVHVKGVTHIMRSTMKNLQEKLDSTTFKRIHRSTIVNLNQISQVIPHTKGEYFLHLKCDENIKVSRNYRKIIKDFIINNGDLHAVLR